MGDDEVVHTLRVAVRSAIELSHQPGQNNPEQYSTDPHGGGYHATIPPSEERPNTTDRYRPQDGGEKPPPGMACRDR
ncbi:hypothetical protein GCM10022254_00470 [Actinomadura meridiana]|uniref:Uncharacterized protein n=1 Tax=Actinomadura meridiana TaxID=559626 RepID=A0ABP8BRD2_9ACTN